MSNILSTIHPPSCPSPHINNRPSPPNDGTQIRRPPLPLIWPGRQAPRKGLTQALPRSNHQALTKQTNEAGMVFPPRGITVSISPSLVSLALGLVAPSALPPASRRIAGRRLGDHHGLVERPLEDLGRGARCPRRCLLLPHVLGLDADVVYLLLGRVSISRSGKVGCLSGSGQLTSVKQGPGVVIRKPSSPCDAVNPELPWNRVWGILHRE